MTSQFTIDGRKISLLGYGSMRIPSINDAPEGERKDLKSSRHGLNITLFQKQVKLMLDKGINYFDTSPAYCRGESESLLGDALKASGYAREDYVIATKLSNFSPPQYPLEECKKMFENSLKFLRTDYIDNYLLHAIGNGGMSNFRKRYLDNGALEWCDALRAQKRIRNLGFSFHGDMKAFDWCLEHHDKYKWDFCQIQMNYIDWEFTNAKELYERLTELKIPVVIMEPLLGGRLARYNYALANELAPLDPEATLAKWALRFCGSFPNVLTILSGMTRTEHIEENVETCSPLKPCSADEFAALKRAAIAMNKMRTIPCNNCNYCMPCPYGLDIPAILTFRNKIITERKQLSAQKVLELYHKMIPEALRRAEHCTACGRCRSHCPQDIDIAKEIETIDAWLDALRNGEANR